MKSVKSAGDTEFELTALDSSHSGSRSDCSFERGVDFPSEAHTELFPPIHRLGHSHWSRGLNRWPFNFPRRWLTRPMQKFANCSSTKTLAEKWLCASYRTSAPDKIALGRSMNLMPILHWGIAAIILFVSGLSAQGISIDVEFNDSSRTSGTLLSVRDTGVVVLSRQSVEAGMFSWEMEVPRLIRFSEIQSLSYEDRSGVFNTSVALLTATGGALLIGGLAATRDDVELPAGTRRGTYVALGFIEGAMLGGLLGLVVSPGDVRQVRITEFTRDVGHALRKLSQFPAGEPQKLKKLVQLPKH